MTTNPLSAVRTLSRWWFLDVGVELLRAEDPTVMELVLPAGTAPPEHVHAGYDDSFLVLDGELVVRQGEAARAARPGDWVCSPAGSRHCFRVTGERPARVLQVFNARSFLDLIIALGEPASAPGLPPPGRSPSPDAVMAAFAAHDVRVVGESMTVAEAQAALASTRRR